MPATCGLQAEGGIPDHRNGELKDGIDLVYLEAIRGREHLGEIGPGLPCEFHSIETVHLQQAPIHRDHGCQRGVLCFAQGGPSRIQVGAAGQAIGAAGEAMSLSDWDATDIDQPAKEEVT